MVTAVDTNVLIDVLAADDEFGRRSADALRRCIAEGSLVACDVVWAEVAAGFGDPDAFHEAMDRLGIRFVPLTEQAAAAAGRAWRAHRRRAKSRDRILADFLIGAHATESADRLVTRDRGFYAASFDRLTVVDPSS